MGDPTVLGMINKNLDNIAKDVGDIKKDMKSGAVTMENHSVRLENIERKVDDIEEGQKKIKSTVWGHVNDKKKHYNQGYKDTFAQRTWRRKDLIALLTVIFAIITWIGNNILGG